MHIAICDTGVDGDHPDLAPNLRLNLAYNAVDNAPGNSDPAVAEAQALCGDPRPEPDPEPDPDPAAPAPPTGVTATSDARGSLTAAWTDASTDETGFEVQYGIKVRGAYQWEPVVSVAVADGSSTGGSLTRPWSGLGRGNYVVQVRAVNDTGESDGVTSTEVRVK